MFSLIIIVPGVISLLLWGLNLSVEFTGGSNITLAFASKVSSAQVKQISTVFLQNKIKLQGVSASGNQVLVKSTPVDDKTDLVITAALKAKFKSVD